MARWGVVLLGLLLLSPARARAENDLLLLEVFVNGRTREAIGTFTRRHGVLYGDAAELRNLGIRVPGDQQRIALRDLPGLDHTVDEAAQQIRFTGSDQSLVAAPIGPGRTPPPPATTGDLGAVLNYDANVTRSAGGTLGAGFADARVFGPLGTASVSALGYAGGRRQPGQEAVVRLDATLVRDDEEALRQVRAGDVISGGLAWTRPVRMGGAQVASSFRSRPDLVTFPVPVVAGSAAVPSTVDVLVNGVRQISAGAEAGPFVLRQPPVVTGAGEVSLVVRDALGRETVTTLPFYASPQLLAEGLTAYSGEAGFVRRRYGLASNDYGTPVAIGTARHGWSRTLTLEAHGEAGPRLASGGAGLVLAVGTLGTVSASAAASTARGGTGRDGTGRDATGRDATGRASGWQVGLGIDRIAGGFGFGASVVWASNGFADAAALDGTSYPRRIERASLSFPVGRSGAFSVAYAGVARDGGLRARAAGTAATYQGGLTGTSVLAGTLSPDLPSTRLVTATFTRPLPLDATLFATAFTDLAGNVGTGALVGVSFPLGGRSAGVVGGSLDGGRIGGNLQASQSTTRPGEAGWRVDATAGGAQRQLAEGEYRGEAGRVFGGVERARDATALRLGARGAVTAIGGGIFLSDTVRDGVGLVEAEGLPGVTVLQENRPIGRTDRQGRLLVTDLRPYEGNRLSLLPEELPPDATVDTTERMVAPRERSGVVVRFGASRGRNALVRLVDRAGRPVPLGAVVQGPGGARSPVGHDGESFLGGLDGDTVLRVTLPEGGRCEARFRFEAIPGDIPVIGPVPCL